MPSPMKAVGRSPRHERHLPGFLCTQLELYACGTRTGRGRLGGGAGYYVDPRQARDTRAYAKPGPGGGLSKAVPGLAAFQLRSGT